MYRTKYLIVVLGLALLLVSSPAQAGITGMPFDGDANGDILISRADGSLTWLERSGSSLTAVFTGANQGAGNVQEIAIGDIDGDGNGDILAARGDGFATWTERNANSLAGVANTNVSPANSVAVGDLDGDANGDMIYGRNDGNLTWVERNSNSLSGIASFNVGSVNAVAIGDLDGDSNGDVIVARGDGLITWAERNGNSLSAVFTGFNVTPAVTIEIGDLDGDADGDIVVGRADGFITYVERSGNNLTSGVAAPSFNLGSIADLALGDADGDGLDEIIVAQSVNGGSVFILNQNGSGISSIAGAFTGVGPIDSITSLDVGDLDGNGQLDIIIGRTDGIVLWLEAAADGTSISSVASFNVGSSIVDLRVASATVIPEPTSLVLLVGGLLGLLATARQRT